MVWCSYCAKDQETESDDINGFTCCTGCGRVLDDNVYSSDPTFTKTADGQSQVQGNFIRDSQYSTGNFGSSGFRFSTDSHERTLEKGRREIKDIADFLAMSGRDDAVVAAHRLYTLAIERNFTRGRRTNQVAAACLYIVCRQDQKPFLLIDFSDCLQTNVYLLGAVFLQLCRLLRLEQHTFMQKPVDPSLFIHRFTDRLVGRATGHGKKFYSIANTALRLVASMKRDWLQTGRRPSGICGAALFISAHIHGFECTKTDVVSVVHICESTLKKRLIEFENTESGGLTAEEFEVRAKELELQQASMTEAPITTSVNENGKVSREVLCEHKELGATHFALGLCHSCYEEFARISGGIQGGELPPAFQRAEQKRMEAVRQQMREQGLLSDEEDQIQQNEGHDCSKRSGGNRVEGRRRGKGRGRGMGQGRGQGKGWRDSDIGEKETQEDMGKGKSRGRKRGRGRGRGRVRGRKKNNDDANVVELLSQTEDKAVNERERSGHIGQDKEVFLMEKEQEAKHTNHNQCEDTEVTANLDRSNNTEEAQCCDLNEMFDSQQSSISVLQQPFEKDDMLPSSLLFAMKTAVRTGDTGICKEIGQASLELPGNDAEIIGQKVGEDTEVHLSCGTTDTGHFGNSDAFISDSANGIQDSFKSTGKPLDHESDNDDGGTLSDIDDNEVEFYLHNEEEVRLKTIIWTEMNKEYLEQQAAKEEALAAAQAAQAAALAATAENFASAVELAAAAAVAVAELRKDRKRKRLESKNKPPADSAAEATRQMLQSKKLSSKVNYSALENLFDGDVGTATNNNVNSKVKDINNPSTTSTKKHVNWSEETTVPVTQESQNLKGLSATRENEDCEDELLEGDDFLDEYSTIDGEDEQIPSYHLPYDPEDVDDEYTDY